MENTLLCHRLAIGVSLLNLENEAALPGWQNEDFRLVSISELSSGIVP